MRYLSTSHFGIGLKIVTVFFILSSSALASRVPDLVRVCLKECPGAKDNADVLNCTESREHDTDFKKSKCGREHAKLEKMMGGHHDHSNDPNKKQ